MRFIIGMLLVFSCASQAEEIDFDCLSQIPEELNLPDLSGPGSNEEFRIYECVMFGLDVTLSKIIRFFPHNEINDFNMPFYQKSYDVGRVKVNEYLITSGFEKVYRFQEWTPDYQSKVDDGAWYELEYNWKGNQGKAIFVNPDYGADIDAQMLARLWGVVR